MFQSVYRRPVRLFALLILVGCSQAPDSSGPASAQHLPMTDGGIPLSTNSDAVFALYNKAREEVDRGNIIDANQAAWQLTQAYPDFAGGWLMLSRASLSSEQYVQSSKRALETAEAGGTEGERLWAAVNRAFVANNTDAALQRAKELTSAYPDAARTWMVLSGVEAARAEYESSRTSLLRAVELDPDLAAAHAALGLSYLNNSPKDFGLAERYLLKAVDLQPNEDNAWINLGDLHRAKGDLEQARSNYTRAMSLDPENAIAPVKRGHVNSFLGHFDRARSDYDAGIRVAQELTQVPLGNFRAFVSVHEGRPEAAADELRALLDRIDNLDIPEDQRLAARVFTLKNLANLSFYYGMDTIATACVDDLVQALLRAAANSDDPGFARNREAHAAYWRGRLAARTGRYADALAYAARYRSLLQDDKNPRRMERYRELLGLTALLQNRFEDAIVHFRQADLSTSAGGGDIRNVYMLSQALSGAGYQEESAEYVRKIADWNFNSIWFAMLRKSLSG